MADVKISQLPAATTPLAGTEQIPLVQSSTTKQVTVSNLLTAANLGTPTAINLTNATNVPVDEATGILPVANGGNGTATPSLVGGTNIAVSGTWPNQTITATGTAAGNVTGPVSSTDNAVVRFDNTTGQVIQNSGVIINDSGEVTVGVWKGTEVTVPYGGTGVSTLTGIVKGNGQSAFSAATAGTDYVAPGGALGTPSSGTATNLTGLPLSTGVTGTLPVANGGTGTTTPSLVAGTNVTISGTWPNQTIAATGGGGGGGSVTDVSVVSANGLAGTVATSTTTPAITLSTTVTGVVKGNGTALSAATAGTDYVAPGGALGTPSSGTLTNTTGLPLSTGVTGTLPIANGGSGQTTAQAAMNAFAGATTSGSYLRGDGTNVAMSTIQAADVPTLNQNTTGSAGSVANALTAGTGISFSSGTTYNGSAAITINSTAVATYPGAGIPNSTGSAWGTSYSTTGSGTVVALATSPSLTTPILGTPQSGDFSTGTFTWPTFNQNTTGTAAGLSSTLAVGSGGTGATSLTVNNVILGNGTSPVQVVAPGTAGNVLTSNGTTWSSTAPTAQVYPGSGIAVSTGSAWTTSLTAPSGTIVGTTDTQTLTNKTFTGYTETVYALSGTAIDPANGTIQTKTLSGNTTFTESLADGQSVVLMVNPSTYTVTWPTMTWINVAGSGSAPTLEASSMNVVVMWQAGGTVYGNWAGSAKCF